MITIKGTIVTPKQAAVGRLAIEGDVIQSVHGSLGKEGEVHDYGTAWVVPGFIDVHMHGMGGYLGVTQEDIVGIAYKELEFGTTGFLPTQGGITVQEFVDFGLALGAAQKAVKSKAAKPIGAHFEGPFINPQRKGAFKEEHLRVPNIDECKTYLDALGGIFKLITMSPELPSAEQVIHYLAEHGVVVSAGHTLATREQFTRAVDAGVTHVTHLFNTFLPSGWAEDGVWDVSLVETALIEPRVNCELICDLHHVHPIHLKMCGMILHPERFVAITDSCSYGGYEPGEYLMLDGREYSTRSGAARLTSGPEKNGLIGSVLTMDRAFANLVEACGFDVVTAARFTATNPARTLRMDDRVGAIEAGKTADIAVLDKNYHCIATYIDGQRVYQAK